MSMPIVTKTAQPQTALHRYAWDCPDCGASFTDMRWAPESREDALCYRCSEIYWEREFQKRHVLMIQAKVVSVESRGEKQEKKTFRTRLVREGGRAWVLTGWGEGIDVKEEA